MRNFNGNNGNIFGTKIRDLRQDRGLNQLDVATAVGCPVSRISKWEMGQGYPEPASLMRLADVLDVDIRFLCDDTLVK